MLSLLLNYTTDICSVVFLILSKGVDILKMMTSSEICDMVCGLFLEESKNKTQRFSDYGSCDSGTKVLYGAEREYDYDEYDNTSEEDDDFWYEEERERLRQEEEDWYDEQERLREEESERAYHERLEEIKDHYPTYNIDLVPDGADLDDVERDARLDDYLMNW